MAFEGELGAKPKPDMFEGTTRESWEGSLPYTLYGGGDCAHSTSTGTATTTAIKVIAPGTFCESDIFMIPDPTPVYSKMEFTLCGFPGSGVLPDAIYAKAYNCASSDCSDCDESPEFFGYITKSSITAAYESADACFGWTTQSSSSNNSIAAVFDSYQNQRFNADIATLEEIQAYWGVVIDNSCVGPYMEESRSSAALVS
eukprot:CAMPEP_0198144722 /NCGR_PEP_ID=MMETSP1443-20131203/18096_1 /TAXON_ID=186043 /ORGANISM="Entomoneis sp., Strain CCMP2396" /LENGTH=199 /DNA_ID=CAMNT_0043808173 /DNA_START=73 /DNA_END=669 /DNA_ORIENTATION=+